MVLLSRWMIQAASLVLFALCSVMLHVPCQGFARDRLGGDAVTGLQDEGDGQPDNIDNGEFLRQLFQKYGDDSGRISFQGFVELVGSIGLGGYDGTDVPGLDSDRKHNHHHHHHHIEWYDQDTETTSDEHLDEETATSGGGSPSMPVDQPGDADRELRDGELPGRVRPTRPMVGEDSSSKSEQQQLTQCLSPDGLLGIFDIQASTGLTQEEFLQMCPVLLQQLDSHVCMQFPINGGDSHQVVTNHDGHEDATNGHAETNNTEVGNQHVPGHIWGYGIAAITLISLTSIMCILIVPCMQRFPNGYHRLISVLVAMAVGTLSGDALMHLIPHSLGIHVHDDTSTVSSDDDDHSHEAIENEKEHALNAVWKGFFVLVGIFSFFIIEQLMGVCQQARKTKKAKRKKKHRTEKSGSQKPLNPNRHYPCDNHANLPEVEYNMLKGNEAVGKKLCHHCVVAMTPGDANKEIIRNSMLLIDDVELNSHLEQEGTSSHRHNHEPDPEVGPGNHHGHSHDVPKMGKNSIATLAWIVVLGDGLHNFCDGLVVGAAFADSIAGGLSTSIAVMCHEVPHELGDFAVMLKAGMTIKQALFVQAISSVLAYMGLAIGIAAGNVEALSMWIFALAGGMFIYIALVDLFPELVETLSSRPGQKLQLLLLQGFGTALGVCIMLFIGLQEDWLRKQLGS
ncbi:zinc transporter ZIP10-like [Asterias rubens]|uniref:zinc transporter ZIP10-like n=1 Tax=Asterias rubens TaxID=7604 RepID=UPI00145531EE|nr:zinc transporter ZIP10-like [Asterias rubens]